MINQILDLAHDIWKLREAFDDYRNSTFSHGWEELAHEHGSGAGALHFDSIGFTYNHDHPAN